MTRLSVNKGDTPRLETGRGASRNIESLKLPTCRGLEKTREDMIVLMRAGHRALEGQSGDPWSHPIPATRKLRNPEQVPSHFGDFSLLLVNKEMGQAGLRVTLSLRSGLRVSVGFQLQLTILD